MRRTGYNILGEFLNPPSGDIRPAILAHLAAYRPTVITVMDNPSFAVEALEATGGETMVIHRHYYPREGYAFTEMSAEDYANYVTYNRTLDKRLWPQVWNEPTTEPNRLPLLVHMTLEVADILTSWGYHAVLGNIGTATIQLETIAGGVFDPLLLRAATWEHRVGYHEYTAILAPFGVGYWSVDELRNPQSVQPANWPEITPLDIQDLMAHELGLQLGIRPFVNVPPESEHYWHILRLEWLQERAELIGAGRHKYIITENFLDRMGDVTVIYPYLEQTYGIESDSEIKGAPTLEKVWRAWWPFWTRDRALAEQCWWLERTYPDECIGWTIFCICRDAHMTNKAQRWEPGYDISDWAEFQNLMVTSRDVLAKPEPLPDPDPDPNPIPDTPEAPPWLLWLFIGILALVLGAVVYFVLAPRLNASATEVSVMEFVSLDQAGVMLITTIVSIVAGLVSSPIVVNLTALLKRLPFMQNVKAEFIAYPIAGLLGAGFWIFQIMGKDAQFVSYMDILNVAIAAAVTILGSLFGGTEVYNLAVKRGVSVVGHKRS